MARRKQRIRSPHPGVVLKERTLPSGKSAWRARFDDPDTGREVYVTLDPVALATHEARRLWAVRKAKALAARRMELEAGAAPINGRPIAEATNAFLKAAESRLRARTLVTYGQGMRRLVSWADKEGVQSTAELTGPRLVAFREQLVSLPRHKVKAGGKRGERAESKRRRNPHSINAELRAVKTLLNAWREGGRLPLSKDAIASALKPMPTPREQPDYLAPAQIGKLLQAAMRHDAATFAATRAEYAGKRPAGSTHRYDPIAPFVAVLLLTGMRRSEGLGLTWASVDLDARDSQGRTVGEIRLRAEHTKTHHARTIGLEVSPALRSLLAAMKLRAGKDPVHVFEALDNAGKRHAYTADMIEGARARLVSEYGAPSFDWQLLRSTCGTYLTNAPGIFGSATVFLSAKQLGHSVQVAERHYLGVHRGIPKDAQTLEAAMQVENAVRGIRTTHVEVATGTTFE